MAIISVSTTTISHAQFTGLGSNKTGTASVTNNNATVTLNTALPANLVGRGGYQISLNSVIYEVLSTESTTSITLTAVYAGSTNASVAYILYPCIELRFYVQNSSFTPAGTTLRVQMGSVGSPGFYKRVCATVRPISGVNSLIIPTLTLYSTSDIVNTAERSAKYAAHFYRLDGSSAGAYAGFESFALPATPTSTDWTQIATYNLPAGRGTFTNETYNRDQVNSLLNSNGGISATPNYLLKANTGTTGANAAAYETGGNIVFTGSHTVASALDVGGAGTIGGEADLAGGFKLRTTAQIAALTAGSYGRLTRQTDGRKGLKKDYGSTVGIHHWQPHYDARELGMKPNDNTAGAANLAAWNAFTAALAAAGVGATVRFSEDVYDFSGALTAAVPLNIKGAAMVNFSDSAVAGTVLRVPSGNSGLVFTLGSKTSMVSDLSIVTASGYSGQTLGSGIHTKVVVHLRNVNVRGFAVHGFFMDGDFAAGLGTENVDSSTLTGCYAYSIKRDGFHFQGSDANICVITACHTAYCGRHGFYNNGLANTFIRIHNAYSGQLNPVSATTSGAITLNASPQVVTLSNVTGIAVGSVLNIDSSTSYEVVVVTAVAGSTITAIFTKNHSGGVAVTEKQVAFYDDGTSNAWELPYAEDTGTDSNLFFFGPNASHWRYRSTNFGAPVTEFFSLAVAVNYGSTVERNYARDIRIKGYGEKGDTGSDHLYRLVGGFFDYTGGLILVDETDSSARLFSYNPATRTMELPGLSFSGVLKANGTPQTITGAGTINLTTNSTLLVTTAANAYTLAAGAEGQYKFIRMKTDGGDATITVTNLEGGTTIVMDAAGQSVYLLYQDAKWNVLANSGATIS